MIVVIDTPHYEQLALGHIGRNTNIRVRNVQDLDSRHLIYYPYTYPCLVRFYTDIKGWGWLSQVVRIKKEVITRRE